MGDEIVNFDREVNELVAREQALDAWSQFKLSKPRNGLHLWRMFRAYRSAGLPLPEDVLKVFDHLADRVLTARSTAEAQLALYVSGKRRGRSISTERAEADTKEYWIAIDYRFLRSGARRVDGRQLSIDEIELLLSEEHEVPATKVRAIASKHGLTVKRKPRL